MSSNKISENKDRKYINQWGLTKHLFEELGQEELGQSLESAVVKSFDVRAALNDFSKSLPSDGKVNIGSYLNKLKSGYLPKERY